MEKDNSSSNTTKSSETNTSKFCQNCESSSQKLFRCSGCKLIYYCSKKCQKKHWKLSHRLNCETIANLLQQNNQQSTVETSEFTEQFFDQLNDDTLGLILKFVGKKSFAVYGLINKRCHQIFLESKLPKETFMYGYMPKSQIEKFMLHNGKGNEVKGNEVYLREGIGNYCRDDILSWLPIGPIKIRMAAYSGKLDIVQNIVQSFEAYNKEALTRMKADDRYVFYAAEKGHLHVIKFLVSQGFFWNEWVCPFVANYGHLHVIQWILSDKGYTKDEYDCIVYGAASCGQLHVLKWLKENGYSIDDATCCHAAAESHINVLEFLKENDIPINAHAFDRAAKENQIESIKWLLANDCPYNGSSAYAIAKSCGHNELALWLENNRVNERQHKSENHISFC